MKYLFFSLFFCAIYSMSIGQAYFSIIDSITQKPIPFATIKVKNKPLGFYADENGRFELSNTSNEDTLIISCVGYNTHSLFVNQIFENNNIKLAPKTTILEEVVVRYKNDENVIDYPIRKEDYFWSADISVEHAYKVLIPKKKLGDLSEILMVKIKMKKANLNNPCRLHIYDMGKDGMPSEELLTNDIQITDKNISKKEFSVDLTKYNIATCDSIIFVGIEWLGKIVENDDHEGPRVAITHAFEEARTYTRTILDKNHQWVLLNHIFPPFKKPANIIVSVTYK